MSDPEMDTPDPETVMDGSGVSLRDFEAYLDRMDAALNAETGPEKEREAEAG